MTKLSLAAQSVLDAYKAVNCDPFLGNSPEAALAAALRAAASENCYEAYGDGWFELVVDVSDLYSIANELEKLND
jgi:hypothetical protein